MTAFFAAANTESGFHSLFPECFSPEEHRRIYIIKGGPGTGKSTFMKALGTQAEANGYTAEYFYCSSDTDSLDGIRIPALGIAVLDGTAPHTAEPMYPGAVERIIDLGEAFDHKKLEKEREQIIALQKAKAEAYRTAYRLLSAAGHMAHEREDLLMPCFLSEKAEGAAMRLTDSLKKAKKGKETERYLSAIGTKGYIQLQTLRQKAKKVYAVTEKNGLEYLVMHTLYAAFHRAGFAMTVCRTPLIHSHIEAIYIEGEDILWIVSPEKDILYSDKIINCMRFVSKDLMATRRVRLRFCEKCMNALTEEALASLADAGRYHRKSEDIYQEAMDFSVVDQIKNQIFAEIFANKM